MIRLTKIAILLLVVIFTTLAMPSASPAQISVGVGIHIGPPALPVYVQPVCPGEGYIWTPGYWAYGDDDYYWVPGTWVLAPEPGLLWTPGYWGWGGGVYMWHGGYWGPHVGFYGGINYGFGYGGAGFYGGEWRGGVYHYNTSVTNVNTTVIHNTYVNNTVINNNTTINRASYNGGHGGTTARATHAEQAAEREHHIAPTAMQTQHQHAASTDRSFRASENHGNPAVAASARPGVFHGSGVVAARGNERNANRPSSANTTNNANKPMGHNDRPPSAMNTRASVSANTRTNGNRPSGNYNDHSSNRPAPANTNSSRQPQTQHAQNSYHPQPAHNNESRPREQAHESKESRH